MTNNFFFKTEWMIKPFISQDALITVFHAFVTSHIDSYNFLADCYVYCLEQIQNEEKTDNVYMASPYYSRYLETPGLQIGESSISPTDLVEKSWG